MKSIAYIFLIATTTLLLLTCGALALNNGVGLTPQMGWNSWNKFACNITESLIKQTADKIIELGLNKLGYTYVNLDDCWNTIERDASGKMQADPSSFPSGMKSLGDYIHEKGLKFGIYSSAGNFTCEGRAGSLYHEEMDAQTFAAWGVDYLKYDNCFNENVPAIKRYTAMRDALNKTGRPVFYSICNWGYENTVRWAPEIGNSWRTTDDIKGIWASIEYNFRVNALHPEIAGPGAWNDPDMLEVGNNFLTLEQEKTHFALWCIVKAPLILGCDLDKISKESFAIITNEELIAVNQDMLGMQGKCASGCGFWDFFLGKPQVYSVLLSDGDFAVIIVNWNPKAYGKFSFELSKIGVPRNAEVHVRDLWNHSDYYGVVNGKISVDEIPAHGNYAFRLRIVGGSAGINIDDIAISGGFMKKKE